MERIEASRLAELLTNDSLRGEARFSGIVTCTARADDEDTGFYTTLYTFYEGEGGFILERVDEGHKQGGKYMIRTDHSRLWFSPRDGEEIFSRIVRPDDKEWKQDGRRRQMTFRIDYPLKGIMDIVTEGNVMY